MREYGFELRLCAHLEIVTEGIVARQLGGGVHQGGRRILDSVIVEPGPEFDRRRRITEESIPPAVITAELGPGQPTPWSTALSLPPDIATRVLERAIAVGFLERVRCDGGDGVRQPERYPDWFGEITAIENKPDLEAPGGLSEQLRFDASIGLVDYAIVATASHVTGAHLNRLPSTVGVWRVHQTGDNLDIEVVREPSKLDSDSWGLELGAREPLARQVQPVSPAEKATARVRIAERAYGKGWRPAFPGCEQVRPTTAAGSETLPYCDWHGRLIDPASCGPACPGFGAGDPPPVDSAAERDARTPWDKDPPGIIREQASLLQFATD